MGLGPQEYAQAMGSVHPLGIEHPAPPSGRRRRLAAALVVTLIGAGMMVLSLNGGSLTTTETAPHLQTGPVTSFESIAGTYFRLGVGEPMYFRFFEDGTVHVSSNTSLVADRPMGILSVAFDGTNILIVNGRLRFGCPPPDMGGSYEIHVMPNGNLQFVALDVDSCRNRSGMLLGLRFGITTAQFIPVEAPPEAAS